MPLEEAGCPDANKEPTLAAPAPSLEIEVRPGEARDVLLALRGELDLSTAPSLQACMDTLDGGYRQVVIDLEDLDFLDSTGIALLLQIQRSLEMGFKELTIRCPEDIRVRRVLAVSGADQQLVVVP